MSFKDVAPYCDTQLFETSIDLISAVEERSSNRDSGPQKVGEIVLQMFRLPPLPGIPADQLPQSLEECLRGMRHINWHKITYHEGVLTQNGGDCKVSSRAYIRSGCVPLLIQPVFRHGGVGNSESLAPSWSLSTMSQRKPQPRLSSNK